MPRTIVHVDMDAFYAAIELLDNPTLKGKPIVIGADPRQGRGRGVVSTASYEARKFGIRSAMPVSTAYKLCPTAIFLPPRMGRYSELSSQVMATLEDFTPLVEPVSIDEAFMDCSGTERLFGSPRELGLKIKEAIRKRTGLTASAGIADNKSVAKIASDLKKPDGLVIVESGKSKDFLAPLPIEKIWGVGKKTANVLRDLGFNTIGDVQRASAERLTNELAAWGEKIFNLANGIDKRPVAPGGERKSISEEHTFETDSSDLDFLTSQIDRMAESLSVKMKKENIRGRTLEFKIRLTGFLTYSRSKTIPKPTNDMRTLREFGLAQLTSFDRKGLGVRLIGIGVSQLGEKVEPQLSLFDLNEAAALPESKTNSAEPKQNREKMEKLLFEMSEKYNSKVKRGSRASDS